MSGPPDNQDIINQWIEKAEHDLLNAQHTLTMPDNCPYDTVCFHAQQCAEKYLKALLVKLSVDFPKTHDLRILIQLCLEKTSLALDQDKALVLNRYTVEARSPGDWEPVTRDEAEEAVSIALQVRDAVKERLIS